MDEPTAASVRAWLQTLRGHGPEGAPLEAFAGESGCFALLRHPEAAERWSRRGVTLIGAGDKTVSACLVFRNRVYGVYGRPAASADTPSILREAAELALGWLPDEAVRASGGFGAALATTPPEAEGFPLRCIAGPGRAAFAEHGKIIDDPV